MNVNQYCIAAEVSKPSGRVISTLSGRGILQIKWVWHTLNQMVVTYFKSSGCGISALNEVGVTYFKSSGFDH